MSESFFEFEICDYENVDEYFQMLREHPALIRETSSSFIMKTISIGEDDDGLPVLEPDEDGTVESKFSKKEMKDFFTKYCSY